LVVPQVIQPSDCSISHPEWIWLLDRYGAAELQAAIQEALVRDAPHPNAVRLALEQRRAQRGDAPPVAIDLPAHLRARDVTVSPHALETYDQLKEPADE
jgi:hypothetical protein